MNRGGCEPERAGGAGRHPADARVVRFDALAARAAAAPASAGTTRVVAVDGPSGSGKTTLAARLARVLDAPVVHLDDLYPGWDGLCEGMARLVDWVLEPLARGGTGRYRRYDWEKSAYAEWHDVPASAVLVVEGVGSGCRAAAPFLVLLAWIEASLELRMARGIARDGEAYRPHWERWARQESELFAAEGTRERADVLIDGAPAIPHDPDTEYVAHPQS